MHSCVKSILKAHSCSIDCYKRHQTVHADNTEITIIRSAPTILPPKPPPVTSGVGALTAHRKSGDTLTKLCVYETLEHSPQLRHLYIQYPRLRNQLKEIYEATTEPSDEHHTDYKPTRGRNNRYYGRGRGREHACRRGLVASWSHDKGFKAGLHQMRKSRHSTAAGGNGLRDFCNLVARTVESNAPHSVVN